MIVRNGTEHKTMLPEDFNMVSSSPTKISLHYTGELWGDLYLDIMGIVFSRCQLDDECSDYSYDQLVANASMDMFFNVQKNVVRLTAHIDIDTSFGDHINGRVFLYADDKEIKPVLDRFFHMGGMGVNADYLNYFKETYAKWCTSRNS